jgi:hypothetical protein
MSDHAKPLPATGIYPPDTIAVTEDQWRDAFYRGVLADKPDTKRRSYNRGATELLAARVVASVVSACLNP